MLESTKAELTDFIHRECELLDMARFEEWLGLFTPDGQYWIPLAHGQESPEEDFSLMIENPLLLRMRIERMQHPLAHGMTTPIYTSRLVGNILMGPVEETAAEVSARFMLTEVENDRQRVFSGKCSYSLVKLDSSWRMKRKRIDLVNCASPLASIQIIL